MTVVQRPIARALAPRPRLALAVAALAVVVLLALGVRYAGQTIPGAFDRSVDGWFIARFRRDEAVAFFFADLGNLGPVLFAVVVLALFLGHSGDRRGLWLAIGAPVVAMTLTEVVLKPGFNRVYQAPALSYPSGHAVAVATVLGVIAVLTPRWIARPAMRRVIVAGCGVVAVATGLGLVAAHYHYTTDVVGGFAMAAAIVLGLSVAIDALARRT